MKDAAFVRVALLLGGLMAPAMALAAGIATDGTVGPRQQLNGAGGFQIPDTLGTRRGGNLFHSFSDFQLGRGETATFSQTQGGAISSVFARVSGLQTDGSIMRSVSKIEGTLRSTIPGASLYFFNPAGLFFGPKATIEIDGSFAVSSAEFLGFSDGVVFPATPPAGGDSLTSADISSFGFLGNAPATLEFAGSQINMLPGRGFTAIGGDIAIKRPAPVAGQLTPPGAVITAPGGRVTLTSVSTAGTVALDGRITAIGRRRRGTSGVSLKESFIDTSGAQGGGISIRAPKLTLTQSGISSSTTGDARGQSLSLAISGPISLGKSSSIGTQTTGSGAAGAVNVSAGSVRVTGDSLLGSLASATTAKGATAGAVRIRAGQLTLAGGGRISSISEGAGRAGSIDVAVTRDLRVDGRGSPLETSIAADTRMTPGEGSGGRGGNVRIRAGSLTVTDGARIGSNTKGDGHGGDVSVSAKLVRVERGGRIDASTGELTATGPSGGRGGGGNVSVNAGTLSLDGQDNPGGTGIFANNDSSNPRAVGGSVSVRAGDASIRSGSLITTRLTGPGRAGDVEFTGRELNIDRGTSSLFTGIAADSAIATSGAAGNVRVEAGRITVLGGGQISSFTAGAGKGGDVSVKADEFTIVGSSLPSVIGTESQSSGLGGDGGDVFVDAGKLTILSGGRISASTFGAGSAGDVRVHAGEVYINQGLSLEGTGVLSESVSEDQPGAGGSVWLDAQKLTLVSGGRVSAATFGPGAGGDVIITAGEAFFSSEGTESFTGLLAASRSTTADGAGGSVRATFDHLSLRSGSISATTAGPGFGGSVFVEAGNVALGELSAIAASATGTGAAGSVAVTSGSRIDLRGGSSITVRSNLSDAGSIRLVAPDFITLQDSTILAEAGLNGGDVFIDPQFVILDHSTISANAILGAGGNITLISDTFLASESAVTASSEASVQGTIDIQSPDAQLANALTSLPGRLLGTEIRLSERCAMRLGADLSSFLVIGRGGLPPAPEDLR